MSLPKSQNQQLILVGVAAKFLGVSVDTIRRWEKKGMLKSTRPNGKDRYFLMSDLEKLKASQTLYTTQAAKQLGVSPITLRKLDKKGIIEVARNQNGARIFTTESLEKIHEQTNIPQLKLKLPEEESFIITQIKPKLTTVEELLDMSRKEAEKQYQNPLTEGKLQEFADNTPVITNLFPVIASDQRERGNLTGRLLRRFTPRNDKMIITAFSGVLASLLLATLILARVYNFQLPNQSKQIAINNLPSTINQDVLAATTSSYYLDFNSDLIVEGNLAIGGLINNIAIIPSGNNTNRSLTVAAPVTLDQDLSTTSSPTFAGLTVLSPITAPSASTSTLSLTGTKDQITFDVSGIKSTLSWTPTSAVTLTLPNITDTIVTKTSTDTLTNKTIAAGDNTLTGSFTGITGLGTIGTGTWNGTKIGTGYGGTGITTYTTGDLIYASASNTLANLAVGTNGQVLTLTGGVPTWDTAASTVIDLAGGPTSVTGILPVTNGGTGASTLTGVIKGNGTSAMTAMTGTASYVTRWSDANTLSTGVIFDNGTNVGIGTTNPTSQLEIKATTNPALTVYAGTGSENIFSVMNNAGDTTYFAVDSTGQMSASAFQLTDSARAVIGTAIPGGWTNIASVATNDFTYRRAVSVTATGNLAANFEVTLDIVTAATASQIYTNTYNQADPYKDFRLFYTTDGGSTYTEVARNVTTFSASEVALTFQLQAQINDAQTSSTNYYLFYSNSAYAGMTTPLTYTGDLNWDSHTESTTGWTSGDSAYQLSTSTSPAPQAGTYSLKTVAMVDRMGAFATTNQGQLLQNLTDSGALTATVGSSTYVYVVGGTGTNGSVIYKSTISSNNLDTFTTTANLLPQELAGATAAITSSADTGTGGDALNTSTGVGCSGTGLSFAGSTCTITATGTYNFASITIPAGTTLTASQGVIPTIKVTGTVSVAGTIDLAGKGSAAGAGANPGIAGSASGGGGGYGGAGGRGGDFGGMDMCDEFQEYGGAGGGTSSTELALGSGGGGAPGGAGGGAIKIVAGENITVEATGIISANGNSGTSSGGGGSGGSIVLQSYQAISNSGAIRTNGGNGGSPSLGGGGGGGGGGRIALGDSDGAVAGTITASGGTKGTGGSLYEDNCYDYGGSDGINGTAFTIPSPSTLSATVYLYVLGGSNGGTYQSTVYKTTLNSTTGDTAGALATTDQTQLSQLLYGHTSHLQTVGGSIYLYALGGNNQSNDVSTVYKSTINSSTGNVGAWSTASQGQLPQNLSKHAQTTLTIGSTTYLYIVGGSNTNVAQSTVYKSNIDPTSGDIAAFTTTSQGQLPVTLYDASAATATVGSVNYIYVFGGNNGSVNVSTVYRATIDGSGNIGTFSSVGHAQLDAILSGHQTVTNTSSGTTYFYTIGGTSASAVSTVYRSTTTSDMTNFNISKTITSTNLSNKNDITFSFYSTNNTADLMEAAFYDATGGWQTTTFRNNPANAWETIAWDISGISAVNRDAVTQIRFKVNTPLATEFTTYIDNIQVQTEASGTDTTSSLTAALGAANLTLNAQGTGIVRINYSDPADPTNFPNLAGSGGMIVYNGADTPLFVIDGTGTVTTGIWNGTDVAVTAGGTGASTAADARTNLGLVIGTNVQAYDADLTTYAGITPSANIQSLLASADYATARTNLGLGTIATQNANSVSISGGSIIGITDLAVADGGTGTSTGSITGTGALTFTAGGSNQNVTLTPSGSGYTVLNGSVGIGTTAPLSTLGILGNTSIGATYGNIAAPTSSLIVESNIGIGTTNPVHAIDVVGTAGLSTGTLWTNTSDARVKQDIEIIPDALGLIARLKPSQYLYTPEYLAKHPEIKNIEHYGFIAQDFQQVFPESISTGADGFLQVNASNVIPYITKAIQELLARFDSHETRIKDLESKISSESAVILSATKDLDSSPSAQNDIAGLNLTPPSILLATTSAQLVNLSVTSDATFSGTLTAYSATISDTFKSLGNTFLGNTSIAGDFNIDGTMNITGDSLNSIACHPEGTEGSSLDSSLIATHPFFEGQNDTCGGTLFIQNSPLATLVDFFNGKVIIDNQGNLKVGGNLEIEGAITISAIAGENLSAGEAVYISSDETVNKADTTITGKTAVMGLAISDAYITQPVKIAISGKVNGLTNLIAGKKYYLGGNGQITTTPPLDSLKKVQVGIGFSPTEILIQIFDFNEFIN